MKYTKVSFNIEPNTPTAQEILTAQLAQFAFDSFEETETGLNAYIPTAAYSAEDVKSIQIFSGGEFTITFEAAAQPEQNWNETWEKHFFAPIVIGNKCVIHSPFHTDVPKAEYQIVISPKMAFGTGHHETTGLMVKHILEIDFTNKLVLDMGCGTGILGILAAMRGAKKVLGIDIEEWAFNNANENIKNNNINNMEVRCGDATLLGKEKFDVILANINRNILLEDIAKYTQVLRPNGILLLSGFYDKDQEIIHKTCIANNLIKKTIKEDNKWVALAYMLTK
ncbi:[LSU ribosomal protein L11P]-lysine N-methyltransferase [Saccharicrinis carchari]|uniref:Ribosomal protein L11 methyltransferase n=1 Tax=Saccharicrinis carchari TaxID=1168039 RepID=A0A521B493_SACCC|nr:50S ribosomal protein L11 methyltransferase [Saccharicrinis carchari]SMO41530.1 [LSU ribosomal protein L11P]-lysine N-methyltransferase [Saccharicrinis carchari]